MSMDSSTQPPDLTNMTAHETQTIQPPASEAQSERDPVLAAHITSLRLLFTAWLSHFRSLGYIKESTMEMLDKSVLRKILQLSVKDPKAREAIGTNPLVWSDILSLLRVAIPSLEGRSYATIADPYDTSPAPAVTVYDGPSSNVIVANAPSLLRDLQRLNNTLCVARNVLTTGGAAQNLAAQLSVDREVCCLINLCVKVTARGYDGDGTGNDEEKWQAVINEFKKLLITCLQFLSNLVTLNERLKLMLWVELFDGASEGNIPGWPDPAGAVRPPLHMTSKEAEDAWIASAAGQLAMGSQQFMRSSRKAEEGDTARDGAPQLSVLPSRARSRTPVRKPIIPPSPLPQGPPLPFSLWLTDNHAKLAAQLRLQSGHEPSVSDMEEHAMVFFDSLPKEHTEPYRLQYAEAFQKWSLKPENWEAADILASYNYPKEDRLASILGEMADAADAADGRRPSESAEPEENAFATSNLFSPPSPTDSLYRYMESARDGIRKLNEGKRELLKRLDNHTSAPPQDDHATSPASPVESPASPLTDQPPRHPLGPSEVPEEGVVGRGDGDDFDSDNLDDDEGEEGEDEVGDEEEDEDDEGDEDEDDGEEESSEDEYDRIPGEDGRGLLTDVPLILGPNEIEVLPMIIMSGIVTDAAQLNLKREESQEQLQVFLNMYTIRCHLLLAQENGRNLLRELLIFVAAWDLREEELYFKFMVKIMESILMHGLMPFAYSAFKESKDIISPAQAVIMKLLTKIFHSRQAFIKTTENEANLPQPQNGITNDPTRTVVSTLFSEFRSNIIPQICALIFLQGQIRAGRASIEDFPLNLWDMERMYEGVYQYLEFFAILTDHEEWKILMAEWEVVSELVTLLRELDYGIGKMALVRTPPSRRRRDREEMCRAQQRSQETEGEENDDGEGALEGDSEEDDEGGDQNEERAEDEEEEEDGEDADKEEGDEDEEDEDEERGQQDQHRDSTFSEPAYDAMQTPNQDQQASRAQPKRKMPPPVAIERPYSPLPTPPTQLPSGHTNSHASTNHPAVVPSSLLDDSAASMPASASPPIHDEPADFEWRNLKKLCVLVLSSLVWKNRALQDQVLRFRGIETILRCCAHDEHNPYIREHAIMCLRFCVEGNESVRGVLHNIVKRGTAAPTGVGPSDHDMTTIYRTDGVDSGAAAYAGSADHDNQQAVPAPATSHDAFRNEQLHVPPEVLDAHGYETFMDVKGQVGLRRKEVPARSTLPVRSRSHDAAAGPPRNAEWDGVREIYGGDAGTLLPSTGSVFDSLTSHNTADASYADELSSELPSTLQPGNKVMGSSESRGGGRGGENSTWLPMPKPENPADLPKLIEAITRDLPYRRAELEARLHTQSGGGTPEPADGQAGRRA